METDNLTNKTTILFPLYYDGNNLN